MAGVPLGLAGLALLVKGIADLGNERRDAQTVAELEAMYGPGSASTGVTPTGQTPESIQAQGEIQPGTANIANGPGGQAKQPTSMTSIGALAQTVQGKGGQASPPGSPSYQPGPAPADSGAGDDMAEGMYGYKPGDWVGPPAGTETPMAPEVAADPEGTIKTEDGEGIESEPPVELGPGTGAPAIIETPTTMRFSPRDPRVPRTIWNDPTLVPKGHSITRKLPNGSTVTVTGEGSLEDLYLRTYVEALARSAVGMQEPQGDIAKLQLDLKNAVERGDQESATRLQAELNKMKSASPMGQLWDDFQAANEIGDAARANSIWAEIQGRVADAQQKNLSPEERLSRGMEMLRVARSTGVLDFGGDGEGGTLSISVGSDGNPTINISAPAVPEAMLDQAGLGLTYMAAQQGQPLWKIISQTVPGQLAGENGKPRFMSPEAEERAIKNVWMPEYDRMKTMWKEVNKPRIVSDEEAQIVAARLTYDHHGVYPKSDPLVERALQGNIVNIPDELESFIIEVAGSPMGIFQPGVLQQARELEKKYKVELEGAVKKRTVEETPYTADEAAAFGVPAETTHGDIKSLPYGMRPMAVPTTFRKDYRTFLDARSMMGQLIALADQTFRYQNFLVRTITNPVELAGRIAQTWDQAGIQYNKLAESIPTALGRIVGSEVGNFTNKDVERYRNTIPKIGLFKDSRETAYNALHTLMEEMDNRDNNFRKSIAPVTAGSIGAQQPQTKEQLEARKKQLEEIQRQRAQGK